MKGNTGQTDSSVSLSHRTIKTTLINGGLYLPVQIINHIECCVKEIKIEIAEYKKSKRTVVFLAVLLSSGHVYR